MTHTILQLGYNEIVLER